MNLPEYTQQGARHMISAVANKLGQSRMEHMLICSYKEEKPIFQAIPHTPRPHSSFKPEAVMF